MYISSWGIVKGHQHLGPWIYADNDSKEQLLSSLILTPSHSHSPLAHHPVPSCSSQDAFSHSSAGVLHHSPHLPSVYPASPMHVNPRPPFAELSAVAVVIMAPFRTHLAVSAVQPTRPSVSPYLP